MIKVINIYFLTLSVLLLTSNFTWLTHATTTTIVSPIITSTFLPTTKITEKITIAATPTATVVNQAAIQTSATTTTLKTTTTKKIKTTTAKKQFPFQQVIGLLGPLKIVDVVFLMGRTLGIGKRSFYHEARQLSMALMKQYASVHPKYARLAYVTFASNSSIDYDDISNNITSLDKCQLFPSTQQQHLPLDKVAYKNEEELTADGINGAIRKANYIFQAGKINRPTANQILFLVMDANFDSIEAKPTSTLKIFGIGVGASYIPTALKALVGNVNNSHNISEWIKMMDEYPPLKRYSNPLHLHNVENSTCLSLNSSLVYNASSTDCFCDVDYGIVRLKCKQGFVDVFDESDSKYIPGLGYTRSCKKNPNFKDSCKTGSCTGTFCKKSVRGFCELNVLDHSHFCINGAKPIDSDEGLFCRCIKGFYGPVCSINEDDCRFENMCENNNTCIDDGLANKNFKCECSESFYGDFCQNKPSTLPPKPTPKVVPAPLNDSTSTIVGIVIGVLVGLAIFIGFIVLIAMLMRKKARNRRNYTKRSEMGTSTEASGSASKWSIKNKNNLSVRLSKLWKHRSLRGFKANDGMPSVPWKTNTTLSYMDLQNVSQEEAIFENEVIHDNRPILDNWKAFMINLVNKGVVQKGLMVNVFSKDIITTDGWVFNWSEVYTLDSVFGTETNVNIQNEDYFLKSPENGVACAKSGSQFSHDDQNFLAVAKTKKYLIAGIVALSDKQDGSECRKEVELIMNHVKSEGY